jgi:hypothetical protein
MPIGLQAPPKTGWSRTLSILPLIAVPVLIYNFVAFVGGGPDGISALAATVIDVNMLSGARLVLTWGDMLLVLAIIFLFAEVLKATGTGGTAITNHMLSMGLFIICLMEFLLLASFATSVFFLLTAIVLLDALAGMVVTTISARRDFGVGEGFSA